MNFARRAARVIRSPHLRRQLLCHPILFFRRVMNERIERRTGGWSEVADILLSSSVLIPNISSDSSSVNPTTQRAKAAFDDSGSDKATRHNYHLAYGPILESVATSFGPVDILEIGIGTTDPTHPSSMGLTGVPGASLRAWSYLREVRSVVGGDNSEVALAACQELKVEYVDQRSIASIAAFLHKNHDTSTFTIVIDDGLHAPNANVNVLRAALSELNPANSLIIIEDLDDSDYEPWALLLQLIPNIGSLFLKMNHRAKEQHRKRRKNGQLEVHHRRNNMLLVSSDEVIQDLRQKLTSELFELRANS